MNILTITNSYVPNQGGVASSVQSLANGLRQNKWNVLVLTSLFHPEDESNEGVQRLPLAVWDEVLANDFRIFPDSVLHQRIGSFQPDLIHIHGPFHLGPVATRLADDLALPLVYTHHTRLEEFIHYSTAGTLSPEVVQEFYAGFANQCDLVLVPSREIARDLQDLGVKRPIHVAPSGLAASWFAEKPHDLSVSTRHRIGIVGRVSKEKSSRDLARAAMSYLKWDSKADLVVIGDGGQLDAIRRDAAAQRLTTRVTCTGFVDNRALAAHLDQLDVVINAPDTDTQCIVLLEAQARGVPIIASDIPVAREFVYEVADDISFFPAQDWDVLTGCLQHFFQLGPERRAFVQREAVLFARRFDQTVLMQHMCLLFEQAAVEISPHHRSELYGWVYKELTESLVTVIQHLRTP